MTFSEFFKITIKDDIDWFDPILDRDTRLFIDPFFLFKTKNKYFKECHKNIVNFFVEAFKIAASSRNSEQDLRFRILKKTMVFPEAKEICLGYGANSIDGAGSGDGFAEQIVAAIYESIKLGIDNIQHFEELGIFNEGIGCDRISDIAANLIKRELIEYTSSVCEVYNVPVRTVRIDRYGYDFQFKRWIQGQVELPINPFKEGLPILLVPKEFLGELPTISTDKFWDYCWENKNQEIRDQFNIVLKSEVRKSDIVDIARKNREWVKEYERYREDTALPDSYNLKKDPKGIYQWYNHTRDYGICNPLKLSVGNEKDFIIFAERMIEQFIHFIENNSGYKLLWNDNLKSKGEEATQLLFTGIVKHYCRANNIDISKEVNLGRGPVDFKFSQGYSNRALIEIKLARNSKFWHGIESQLPKYLEVEDIKYGYFVVVCYTQKDLDKIRALEEIINNVCEVNEIVVKTFIIDASRDKASASNIK